LVILTINFWTAIIRSRSTVNGSRSIIGLW